eukprot:g3131.t1
MIYKFAVDIARGVNYLHSKMHIIQRDLKSRNVLVDTNYNAKLADFGLSRLQKEDGGMTACGTPAWTAPEIVKMEKYDERCDVYSFGIVLWELYCRQEPYDGQGGLQIAYAAAEQGLRPVIPTDCPTGLADLMRKCWSEKPQDRPDFNTILKQLFAMLKGASGVHQEISFDKVTARISKLTYGLSAHVDAPRVSQKVISGLYPGITTEEIDELASQTAAYMATEHPDFSLLAARLAISNLHRKTIKSFSQTAKILYEYVHPKTGEHSSLISKEVYDIIQKNASKLDAAIVYDRDFNYDYFGFKTLERSYLLKANGKIVERPQHMLMRVALGIHGDKLDKVLETYNLMSQKFFTHATPTLFNSGTRRPQLSSCFLLTMQEDSIIGIYETLKRCAQISKNAGGIGLSVHNIRSSKSYIKGTAGTSNGLVPMLRVFNSTARYVDQGGGKRKGSIAIYLEPWHPDIFEWLDLRKNHGKEEARARDLFYALWIPDLFMQRVKENKEWSFFCPNECKGLADCHGEEFNALYMKYEKSGLARKTVKAQELWFAILTAQQETGTPYMLFKDACNRKSNQNNLGTIKSSNLCTEIIEYTAPDEVAVCNLASINLQKFVKDNGCGSPTAPLGMYKEWNANQSASPVSHMKNVLASASANSTPKPAAGKSTNVYQTPMHKGLTKSPEYDFQGLFELTKVVTKNLNRVIDVNYYPVEAARKSNMRHRPIGIGVQGLADALIRMRFPFESQEARQLNSEIFETIYFGAVTASMELAMEEGKYETYEGSPMSQGKFQFDLWNEEYEKKGLPDRVKLSGRWDWEGLRAQIKEHGIRNSLLVAPMPTASTSQILGNNECFEPYTSNMYNRRTLSGEFTVVNQHLLRDLTSRNLWTPEIRNQMIADGGSIQKIAEIPQQLKELYKTVWEIKQKTLIDMAADRGAFIDQSQSFNVHMQDPSFSRLTSMHFYSWRKGLKTGLYYLRTRPKADAIQFTVDQTSLAERVKKQVRNGEVAEVKEAEGECLSCGA